MGLLSLLLNDPVTFILLSIPLLYSIIIHELAHGWVAYKMGDPTAKLLGRLSLNPLKHLEPVGTLMLFVFGFGWAKPVPVNFSNLRGRPQGVHLRFGGRHRRQYASRLHGLPPEPSPVAPAVRGS
ncbi:MAG: site-2 protease family protein [Desulfobacterales bacterium]|nr:site-2 protease family protein [Desulfobacterales bacterium]